MGNTPCSKYIQYSAQRVRIAARKIRSGCRDGDICLPLVSAAAVEDEAAAWAIENKYIETSCKLNRRRRIQIKLFGGGVSIT